MKKKKLPLDRVCLLLFALFFNSFVYSGSRVISSGCKHFVLNSLIDEQIPFIPASLVVYFGCYIFWIVNYVRIAYMEEERVYRFYFADFLSRVVCLAFFLLFPTTNVRPEIIGNGFWENGMRFLYAIDEADNLFPSIHCLVSWFCYIGIRNAEGVSRKYQWTSCGLAILVCISTLTTKQHVIWDVAGGILLAEIAFFIANHTEAYVYYKKALFWVLNKITRKRKENEDFKKE